MWHTHTSDVRSPWPCGGTRRSGACNSAAAKPCKTPPCLLPVSGREDRGLLKEDQGLSHGLWNARAMAESSMQCPATERLRHKDPIEHSKAMPLGHVARR